jgi:hypothetical protein
MKVKSNVKAGGSAPGGVCNINCQHNQSLVKVRSGVRSGLGGSNHNQSLVRG